MAALYFIQFQLFNIFGKMTPKTLFISLSTIHLCVAPNSFKTAVKSETYQYQHLFEICYKIKHKYWKRIVCYLRKSSDIKFVKEKQKKNRKYIKRNETIMLFDWYV